MIILKDQGKDVLGSKRNKNVKPCAELKLYAYWASSLEAAMGFGSPAPGVYVGIKVFQTRW